MSTTPSAARDAEAPARVAVTGAAGFIGRYVAEALRAAGHRVVTLDRVPDGVDITSDLADPHALAAELSARNVERVVHCAWAGHPRSAGVDYDGQVRASLLPTLNVMLAAGIAGVRQVVFLSTGGGSVTLNDQGQPPAYGWAKRMAEAVCRANAETFDYALSILRPSAVYGVGQDPAKGLGAVTTFTARALAGEPIRIFGSPEASRDFLHVEDLAEAVAAVVGTGVAGTFAVGGPEQVTLAELVNDLQDCLGAPIEVLLDDSSGVDAAVVQLDNRELERATGWRASRTVRASLPAIVAALRGGAA